MVEETKSGQEADAEPSQAGDTRASQSGDSVEFHYHGTFEDGEVFDSSRERDPMQVTLGQGQLIPGVDGALTGMAIGEKKTVTVPPEQAYGEHMEEMVQSVPRSQMPPDMELEVGMVLEAQAPDRPPMPVTVMELTDDMVSLDANHPLAGKALTFELELVGIGPGA